jgi:type IV secretion system protein VirB6
MSTVCHVLPSSSGFLKGILDFIDCQTVTLGSQGYSALVTPASSVSQSLTILLTLFVAIYGYRMLFGDPPGVRDTVLAVVKVGIVLTLALNWPAYRTLVFDVTLRSPAEFASAIGASSDLPGSGGGLVSRLDQTDQMLASLAGVGAGGIARQNIEGQSAAPSNTPDALIFTGFDSWAIGLSRLSFLTGTMGSLASARLLAAILLALGPVFVTFLLFDATRGLFFGWLKLLGGTALATAAAAVVLGIELALLEPWLVELLTRRYSNFGIGGIPVQLLAVTLSFNLVLLAVMVACLRLTMASTWVVKIVRSAVGRDGKFQSGPNSAQPPLVPNVPHDSRTRAAAIADAVAITERRDTSPGSSGGSRLVSASPAIIANGPSGPDGRSSTRLGQSYRRTGQRASSSANRRDRS